MQVITLKSNDVAVYVAAGNATYKTFDNYTEVYTPISDTDTRITRVMDLRIDEVNVYTGVTDIPSDFIGYKYVYANDEWTSNPDYIEPELPA